MTSTEINVTLKISADTPFRLKDKVKLFEQISKLEQKDQEILLELAQNPKALKGIRDNKTMLLSML